MAAYSQELADSTLASSGQGSQAPGKSKSTPTAEPCSPSISPMPSDTRIFDPSTGFWPTPTQDIGRQVKYKQGGTPLAMAVSQPLTFSPAASLASHSPLPGSELARKMTVTSGRRCLGLSKMFGQDTSLLKTLLESSTWNSTECFLTWKVRVTPSGRLLFQLAPSMPNTDGTEFGLLATPKSVPSGPDYARVNRSKSGGDDLATQIAKNLWPTPRKNLTGNVTPERANDKFNNLESVMARKMFPTPTERDWRSDQGQKKYEDQYGSRGKPLPRIVGGSLNPTWVEWLMGFPLGWTVLKDSAMQSFRKSRMRSSRKLAGKTRGWRFRHRGHELAGGCAPGN